MSGGVAEVWNELTKFLPNNETYSNCLNDITTRQEWNVRIKMSVNCHMEK